MSTIFTIAEQVAGPHSMGGSADEWHVCPEGAYHTGDYPPAFESRAQAEAYASLKRQEEPWVSRKVVPMELVIDEAGKMLAEIEGAALRAAIDEGEKTANRVEEGDLCNQKIN